MKNTIFTGMATAIVTPMTKDGIDYEALGRFLEFQIENGINAIVVMGTTGENATTEYADQKEVIRSWLLLLTTIRPPRTVCISTSRPSPMLPPFP